MDERDPAWDSVMVDSVVEAVGELEHFVSDSEQDRLTLGGLDPVETFFVEKYPAYFQKLPF